MEKIIFFLFQREWYSIYNKLLKTPFKVWKNFRGAMSCCLVFTLMVLTWCNIYLTKYPYIYIYKAPYSFLTSRFTLNTSLRHAVATMPGIVSNRLLFF